MKTFNWLLVIIILVITYVSYRQELFFRHVDAFMNKGNRNTAKMGYNLCERVEHLESQHHDIVHEDCAKIYLGDKNPAPN